jgi:hypothetical protein
MDKLRLKYFSDFEFSTDMMHTLQCVVCTEIEQCKVVTNRKQNKVCKVLTQFTIRRNGILSSIECTLVGEAG